MNHLSRRQFLRAAAAGAACSVWGMPGKASSQTQRGTRPNILFILADDMGWMDCELYGSRYYEMPHLTRLARRGMRFTNAYAASPLCSPTRGSIMTGKYPARLGITTPACHLPPLSADTPMLAEKGPKHQKMVTPQSRRFLPLSEYTIGEAFRDAGYHTGFIGKWHLGLQEQYWPRHQGFLYDLGAPNPGPPSYFSPYRIKTIPDGPEGQYITDRVTDEAIGYLRSHKDEPFLLCWWHFAVHAPYQAKKDMIDAFRDKVDPRGVQDCPTMAAMLKSMDDGIGRVLDMLDELGLADNTIIVFVSDNGGNMYDEVDGTTPTNNAPLRVGKGNAYEGGTRAPCIVVWPDELEPDSQCDEIVSTVDFYPTLLEMAGLPPKPKQHVDGVSFVPALKGQGRLHREAVFCHFPHYVPATQNRPCTWVRKGDWKLLRFYGEGPNRGHGFELYNLKDDIGERNNLADRMPMKVAELNALIDRFVKDTGALVPVKNPAYEPPPVGWQSSRDAELSAGPDGLTLRSKGQDPFITTEDVPIVSHRMVLRFRMRSTITGAGSVYWRDNASPAFAREQKIDFEPATDGGFHPYEISFYCKGRLRGLRIDPGTSRGEAEFSEILLQRSYGEVLKRW